MAPPITESEIRLYLARHAQFIDPLDELNMVQRVQLIDGYVREMRGWPHFMQSLAVNTSAPVVFMTKDAWTTHFPDNDRTLGVYIQNGFPDLAIPRRATVYPVRIDNGNATIFPDTAGHEKGHGIDHLLRFFSYQDGFSSSHLPAEAKAIYEQWAKTHLAERRAHNNAVIDTYIRHPKTGEMIKASDLFRGIGNLADHLEHYTRNQYLPEIIAEVATTHAALYRLSDHLPEPQRTQSVHAELSRAYGGDFYDKVYRPHFHDAAVTLADRVQTAVLQRAEMIKRQIALGLDVPEYHGAAGDVLEAAREQLMRHKLLAEYESLTSVGTTHLDAIQHKVERYHALMAIREKTEGPMVRANVSAIRNGALDAEIARMEAKYAAQLAEAAPHLPLAHRPTIINPVTKVALKTGAQSLIPPLVGSLIAGVMLLPTKAKAEQAVLDKRLTEDQLREWYKIAGAAILAEAPGVMLATAASAGVNHEYAEWVRRENIPKDLAEALNPTMFTAESNSARFVAELRNGLESAAHVPSVQQLITVSERLEAARQQLAKARAESARELPGALPTLQVHETAAARAVRQAAEREFADATKASLTAMEAMLADPAARGAMKVALTRAAYMSLPTEPRDDYPASLNAAIVARNELRAIRRAGASDVVDLQPRQAGAVVGLQGHESASMRARRIEAEKTFWAAVEVVAADGALFKLSTDTLVAASSDRPIVVKPAALASDVAQLATQAVRAGAETVRLAEARDPKENDLPPDRRDTAAVSVKAT